MARKITYAYWKNPCINFKWYLELKGSTRPLNFYPPSNLSGSVDNYILRNWRPPFALKFLSSFQLWSFCHTYWWNLISLSYYNDSFFFLLYNFNHRHILIQDHLSFIARTFIFHFVNLPLERKWRESSKVCLLIHLYVKETVSDFTKKETKKGVSARRRFLKKWKGSYG